MTRRLVVLRHAQADHGSTEDHARPLTGTGRAQARGVGGQLAEAGLVPDLVVCSTAVRTRETLDLVLEGVLAQPVVEYEDAAYGADDTTLFGLINLVPQETRTVLLVGHNPAVAQVAAAFMDESAYVSFPPASAAVVELEVDWLYAAPGTGTGKLLQG